MAPPPYSFADPTQVTQQAKTVAVTVPRPKLRGHLAAQIKKNIFVSLVLAAAGGLAFKILVADVRKQQYAEFYRTYDPEAAFEEMKKKKLFQSC